MANSQEQQSSPTPGGVRVAAFEEGAKKELRSVFAEERTRVRLELKQQRMHVLLLALGLTGGVFLVAVLGFILWLVFGSPCSAQILAFLAVIAALLIASLSVFLGLVKFIGPGAE
jgi:hypothetical protein